ncbi:glycosyltransferase family 4 protein, partial [bacterium]|nr:glycosyltransferase family 4 protein [bacterium]
MPLNRKDLEDRPLRLLIVGRGTLHTANWAEQLHTVAGRRLELHLATESRIADLPGVFQHSLPYFANFPVWGIRGILNRTIAPCWAFFKIRLLLTNIRPDIVHLQSLFYPGWIAGLCVKNIPLVITPWDGDVMWHTTRNPLSWARTKYLLSRASLITCVSQYFADYCKGFLSPKSSPKSIQIHFGYNAKRFFPVSNRSALKSKLGLPDKILVLSTRQIAPIYDIETLLSAIKIVAGSGAQNVHFVFIYPYANKKLLKEFQALIEKWGLKSWVSRIGKVDHRIIQQYYQAADIFISTSLNDTG